MQEDQAPILTIKDAIAAESYFEIPDGSGGKVERGNVANAFAKAKHVIKNARQASKASWLPFVSQGTIKQHV